MKRKINHLQIRENHQSLHITLLLTVILIWMMFSTLNFLHGESWIQEPLVIWHLGEIFLKHSVKILMVLFTLLTSLKLNHLELGLFVWRFLIFHIMVYKMYFIFHSFSEIWCLLSIFGSRGILFIYLMTSSR